MISTSIRERLDDFLAQERIAFVGISSNPNDFSRAIYKRLKESGYEVFPVHPTLAEVDGDPCYPTVLNLPEDVGAAFLVTPPAATEEVVRHCHEKGVARVWVHRSITEGSYSERAEAFCKEHDIAFIPAGCPLMFVGAVDPFHRCLRWLKDPIEEVGASPARQLVGGLPTAVTGWALCGAVMALAMSLTSMSTALWIHLIAAPLIFVALTRRYVAKHTRHLLSPLKMAVFFVDVVVLLDFVIVALIIERDLSMFKSVLGTWLPFALIFLASFLTSFLLQRRSPENLRPPAELLPAG